MERVSFFFFTFSFCHVLPLLTNEWTKWSVSGGFFTLLPQSRVCQVGFYPSVTKWSASSVFLPICHKVECIRWVFYPSATKWSASGGIFTLLPQSGVRHFFGFTLLSCSSTLDECAGQNWACWFLLLQHPPPSKPSVSVCF